MNLYFHIINDAKGGKEIFKSFISKQTIAFGLLCLIVVGCSSYTPYRYSFSLIDPQNKAMSFESSDVEFRFVPSSENIRVSIKNKTDHGINLMRDKVEYIDPMGKSRIVHYGYDYVDEVLNFSNNRYVSHMNIAPNSEITGYVWINNWPDAHIGQGPGTIPISTHNIINRMDPFFPRYSFEGSVQELKGLTFNLILPIDFGGYVHNYTFTFMIDNVI